MARHCRPKGGEGRRLQIETRTTHEPALNTHTPVKHSPTESSGGANRVSDASESHRDRVIVIVANPMKRACPPGQRHTVLAP